ncbi:hypothetical protein [Halobellus rufus]|uniref:hypothetical protein n=1 Tax=Halobellus rufus TaxID=1448860 RepID=UPI00067862E5|nr:hypothetical protein [Halobellus rufus]
MTGDASDSPPDGRPRSPVAAARTALADARAAAPFDARDRPWLALAFLPGVVAVAVYLATNQYPAYGAGLYAKIAAEIAANGYLLPSRIPGYTADGVPFAYPPLQFYLYAALLDLGGDPVTVSRFLPSVGFLAALVPTYLLGRDVAESRPAGAAAVALVALNPQILEWHLSAGGVVRAFALCYAMVAVYAGYRIYAGDDPRGAAGAPLPLRRRRAPILLGAFAFGLTVLTHPVYSLFVVASYVLLWLLVDRSLSGFLSGLAVGLGGALLASPWLAWVVATHGIEIFTAASGTHGGVGGGASALAGEVSPGIAVALVPALYLLVRREYLFPAWLIVAELLFKQPRFAYTVAAILVPLVVVTVVRARDDGGERPRLATASEAFDLDVDRRAAAAAVVILLGTVVGGGYFAYEATLATDPSTPEFLDADAVDAMAWAASETDPDARFVVLGDAAEWFPALTDRTLLVGYWGVEWEGPEAFDRQESAYESVSSCHSAACVERVTAEVGDERPTHVYVPKGQYTIRGDPAVQFGTIERSFERSERWERAYENDGVVIYRSTVGPGAP